MQSEFDIAYKAVRAHRYDLYRQAVEHACAIAGNDTKLGAQIETAIITLLHKALRL
jgi:hypothetical protein